MCTKLQNIGRRKALHNTEIKLIITDIYFVTTDLTLYRITSS